MSCKCKYSYLLIKVKTYILPVSPEIPRTDSALPNDDVEVKQEIKTELIVSHQQSLHCIMYAEYYTCLCPHCNSVKVVLHMI